MASGDTLAIFTALDAEVPATNYAQLDTRNNRPVLDFDATTGETAYFSGILPRNYGGGGITVTLHWSATSAVTGTIGWLVAIERHADAGTDMDADSFAADQTVTAETVSGTSGVQNYSSVAITNGANMDSLAVGEGFRLRVTRDVATDTAAGDAEIEKIEIKET